MIRLTARLTRGGGREAAIGLGLTGLGLALAVTLLLMAAAALPALQQHDIRRSWLDTSAQNHEPAQDEGVADPLLWRLTEARFDGRDLLRVDLAAMGSHAPVPPGLGELPGPGELATSPALLDLLDTTEPAVLGERFPGEVVTTVGRDALASPDDLVVFVGREASELRGEPGVSTVRSIESAPRTHTLTRTMRVALAIGGVGLLAPVVVFVTTATRLQAARRERRLAAMRLAGATQRQIAIVAGVEAAIAAIAGTVGGFGLFFTLRPSLARVPLDGASFYPSDLALSWAWAALIGIGVPMVATASAIVSLRRLRVSALGIARRAGRGRPTPRPLLLIIAGAAALVAIQATMTGAGDVTVALAVGTAFVVMIAGIVLSGPWLTAAVARAVARLGRRAPSLLAARRLEDNPGAGFRAISGVVLAVFVGTVFSAFAASMLADQEVAADGLGPNVVAAVVRSEPPPMLVPGDVPDRFAPPDRTPLEPDHATQLVGEIATVSGVHDVVTAHALPHDPGLLAALRATGQEVLPGHLAMACRDAGAIGLEPCDGTLLVDIGTDVLSTGITIDDALPPGTLGRLPVMAVAAATDGRTATIEQARAQLEVALPGSEAVTRADIDAETQSTIRTTKRVSELALAVTLVIAGCSLTVSVAGTMIERRRALALLRLAGTRPSDLRRMVLAEAAAPLLVTAVASVGLGLGVTALTLGSDTGNPTFTLPGVSYWLSLGGGILVALAIVLTTMPLLNRLTSLDSARFD